MPLRLIGVAGIVVVVVWGIIAHIAATAPLRTINDLDQAVAFACGYNAGATSMLPGHENDPMLEVCQPIKATAAAHGFHP